MVADFGKLTTILVADVVGYSRLVGADESGTVKALGECRALIDPRLACSGGRILGSAGDSVLADSFVACVGQSRRPECASDTCS